MLFSLQESQNVLLTHCILELNVNIANKYMYLSMCSSIYDIHTSLFDIHAANAAVCVHHLPIMLHKLLKGKT